MPSSYQQPAKSKVPIQVGCEVQIVQPYADNYTLKAGYKVDGKIEQKSQEDSDIKKCFGKFGTVHSLYDGKTQIKQWWVKFDEVGLENVLVSFPARFLQVQEFGFPHVADAKARYHGYNDAPLTVGLNDRNILVARYRYGEYPIIFKDKSYEMSMVVDNPNGEGGRLIKFKSKTKSDTNEFLDEETVPKEMTWHEQGQKSCPKHFKAPIRWITPNMKEKLDKKVAKKKKRVSFSDVEPDMWEFETEDAETTAQELQVDIAIGQMADTESLVEQELDVDTTPTVGTKAKKPSRARKPTSFLKNAYDEDVDLKKALRLSMADARADRIRRREKGGVSDTGSASSSKRQPKKRRVQPPESFEEQESDAPLPTTPKLDTDALKPGVCSICRESTTLKKGMAITTCGTCRKEMHLSCAMKLKSKLCPVCCTSIFDEAPASSSKVKASVSPETNTVFRIEDLQGSWNSSDGADIVIDGACVIRKGYESTTPLSYERAQWRWGEWDLVSKASDRDTLVWVSFDNRTVQWSRCSPTKNSSHASSLGSNGPWLFRKSVPQKKKPPTSDQQQTANQEPIKPVVVDAKPIVKMSFSPGVLMHAGFTKNTVGHGVVSIVCPDPPGDAPRSARVVLSQATVTLSSSNASLLTADFVDTGEIGPMTWGSQKSLLFSVTANNSRGPLVVGDLVTISGVTGRKLREKYNGHEARIIQDLGEDFAGHDMFKVQFELLNGDRSCTNVPAKYLSKTVAQNITALLSFKTGDFTKTASTKLLVRTENMAVSAADRQAVLVAKYCYEVDELLENVTASNKKTIDCKIEEIEKSEVSNHEDIVPRLESLQGTVHLLQTSDEGMKPISLSANKTYGKMTPTATKVCPHEKNRSQLRSEESQKKVKRTGKMTLTPTKSSGKQPGPREKNRWQLRSEESEKKVKRTDEGMESHSSPAKQENEEKESRNSPAKSCSQDK